MTDQYMPGDGSSKGYRKKNVGELRACD